MASKILVDELAPQTGTDVTITTGKKIVGANTQFKMTGGAASNIIETDGSGNLSFVTPTVGLSNACQFRLIADFTGAANPITNWELMDNPLGQGLLGTAVTESSGTFTYPTGGTGYWLIIFKSQAEGSAHCHVITDISTTTNNSTYAKAAEGRAGTYYGYCNPTAYYIQKVTDLGLDKVRFNTNYSTTTVTTHGDTDFNETTVTFIKCGVLTP